MTTVEKYKVTTAFALSSDWMGIGLPNIPMPVGTSIYIGTDPDTTVVIYPDGSTLFTPMWSIPGPDLIGFLLTTHSSDITYVGDVTQQDIPLVVDVNSIRSYEGATCSVWDAEQNTPLRAKNVLHFSPLYSFGFQEFGPTSTTQLAAIRRKICNIDEVGFSGPTETKELFHTENVPVAFDIEKPSGSTVQVRQGRADLVVPLSQTSLVFTTVPVISRPFRLRVIDFGGITGGATGTFYKSVVQQSLNADSDPAVAPVFSVSQCTGTQGP